MELQRALKYRGQEISIYYDELGQQEIVYIDDTYIPLGTMNTDTDAEVKYLIDRKLDLIKQISKAARVE